MNMKILFIGVTVEKKAMIEQILATQVWKHQISYYIAAKLAQSQKYMTANQDDAF